MLNEKLTKDFENPKPKKDKPDYGTLIQLLAVCENNDMNRAKANLKELKRYEYINDYGLAAWFRKAIDEEDIAMIAVKIRFMINKMK